MIQSHGSVGIIIYHTEQEAFLMVRQFRPAVSIPPLVFTANTQCFKCLILAQPSDFLS